MVFSSTVFLCIFLPLVLLMYFIVPGITAKNVVLLIFSLFFYAWGEPSYVILMIISIVGNYFFGMLIHYLHKKEKSSVMILILAILLNLGMLFYFKYFSFAVSVAASFFGVNWSVPEIALPIGISFYTFQGMSYVIDVYRDKNAEPGKESIQKNIIKLAVYISMFPQLIAGPIVRYSDIAPRLSKRTHSIEALASGIEIFIIGLSKKVIFANILGGAADVMIQDGLQFVTATQLWVSAILYMLQIYYDFCGYSEMAIGLGRMFGFEFMKNFDYPYISRSITEFWRRWHISLSTWFRDYLYIPLGGNRRGNVYFNLSVVFLATGIWHGADWSFILWGIWHGAFMLLERVLKKKNVTIPMPKILKSIVGWCYTMLVVFFGWIVFRLADLSASIEYFKGMFGIIRPEFVAYDLSWYLNNRTVFVFIMALICCLPWKIIVEKYIPKTASVWTHPAYEVVKRIVLLGLFVVCFLLLTNSTYNPFIYFRF